MSQRRKPIAVPALPVPVGSAAVGFTLIEISIVLVIIGLIVGGVLYGQSLIAAATLQAQITQIQKYNTAANTFMAKCGYLPGDITSPAASACGLLPRGTYEGQGDGNGIIEGTNLNCTGCNSGNFQAMGETVMFWVDLSTAGLIDGQFNSAAPNTKSATDITLASAPNVGAYFPQAKLGL
jgi:prepilin-type N-terminal cleavage/methylation domain-containing protein